MNTSGSTTGRGAMYSLMPHVPATTHSWLSSTSPEASAQASMSNRPPATGVPGARPVSAAASGLTRPQTASEAMTAGSSRAQPPIPNASRTAGSNWQVPTFIKLVPEASVRSMAARPVSRSRV